jgi:oxygen-independent coproporphyrinogen III oxidase
MKEDNKRKTIDLIEKSIKVIDDSNINEVWQAGIRRDPKNYHITVMYPPLKVMKEIDEKTIFTQFNNRSKQFSLYIHIPFCSGKCTFCYFYQIEKPGQDLINRYLSAIQEEIRIIAGKIQKELGHVTIQSIFFGGGSPTILSKTQFQTLLDSIRGQFTISKDTEITVEIHPEIIRNNGEALLETYRDNQVNRLNIGSQIFDDHILKITNRRHTAEEILQTYELARRIGFDNINIDLLYPLPDLTPEIWEKTLNTAFYMEPDSITTYFMAIRKCSPIYQMMHKSPNRFPNEYLNHLFRIMTIERAKTAGYEHRKLIDWFVKPRDNFHYQHQLNEAQKTEEIQLLSFGSGVFSYLNNHQYYNIPDSKEYCERLEKGNLPVWKGIQLSKEERFARAMVLGIKSGKVNTHEIENKFQMNIHEKYNSLLQNLLQLGLLDEVNGSISLSEKGILFADEVAVQFITPDIREKLGKKELFSDREKDLMENYNFMYDMDGLAFLR